MTPPPDLGRAAALVETLSALDLPPEGILAWVEHLRAFCVRHGDRRTYGTLLELLDACQGAVAARPGPRPYGPVRRQLSRSRRSSAALAALLGQFRRSAMRLPSRLARTADASATTADHSADGP